MEIRVAVRSDLDIVTARQRGRELADQLGFSPLQQTLVATAISELARNILLYAGAGDVLLATTEDGDRQGLVVQAHDEGPGIPNVERAMQSGYSTSGGLGLGLAGVKKLMDELQITSELGKGTTVIAKKWTTRNDQFWK